MASVFHLYCFLLPSEVTDRHVRASVCGVPRERGFIFLCEPRTCCHLDFWLLPSPEHLWQLVSQIPVSAHYPGLSPAAERVSAFAPQDPELSLHGSLTLNVGAADILLTSPVLHPVCGPRTSRSGGGETADRLPLFPARPPTGPTFPHSCPFPSSSLCSTQLWETEALFCVSQSHSVLQAF